MKTIQIDYYCYSLKKNSQKWDIFRVVTVEWPLKAMDQPNHVTSVNEITVFKAIRKLLTEMDFLYETKLEKGVKKVCLVSKIHLDD